MMTLEDLLINEASLPPKIRWTEYTLEEQKVFVEKIKKLPLTPAITAVIKNILIKKQTRNIPVSQAIIRPTGLLDPVIITKPITNQVDDVLEQIRLRIIKKQRVIITTLTKKFSEDLDLYCKQLGIKSAYIHSDVDALTRLDILSDLRRGVYDVLIGINLLREGIDLPEVSLVAIFDADKEGFLRSKTSLVQIIGRAARHTDGTVILYADKVTDSMRGAIEETERRREIQDEHNKKYGIVPKNAYRELHTIADDVKEFNEKNTVEEDPKPQKNEQDIDLASRHSRGGRYRDRSGSVSKSQKKFLPGQQVFADFEYQRQVEMTTIEQKITSGVMNTKDLEVEMQLAIDQLEFEKAAAIRDLLKKK